MHEHNRELIAALAEGDLELEEAAAAERDVASCADCSAELAAQRLALAAIADAPRPGLSMAESADLRRAVRAAVGAEPEPEPQPTKRPWLGLVTAAAVVALLLAVVPAANLLRTDTDTAASDTTIASESDDFAATSPAATEAPATSRASAEAPTAATDSATQESAEDGAADGAGELDLLLPTSRLSFDSVEELDELLTEIDKGIELDGLTRSLRDSEFQYYTNLLPASPEETPASCPVNSALDAVPGGTSVVTVGTGELDGAAIIIVVVAADAGGLTSLALDAVTCEVVGQVG